MMCLRPRPILAIISGAPGAGKSTLAHILADRLALPIASRDAFKEALADTLGCRSLAESRSLGAPSFAVFRVVLAELVGAGIGVIAESNFLRGLGERDLHPIVAQALPVLLHCRTTLDLGLRRVVERYQRGERHPCHFEGERIAELQSDGFPTSWSLAAEPLDLGVPTLEIDTSNGYRPDLDSVVSFVREATNHLGSQAAAVTP